MLTATFALAGLTSRALTSIATAPSAPLLGAYVVYGFAFCAATVGLIWALLERRERQAAQLRNEQLSSACQSMVEHHYRERVQAEERHLLTHDSSMRNVLEHLERALLGKPKS